MVRDSWDLPSHVAGDVIDMEQYRLHRPPKQPIPEVGTTGPVPAPRQGIPSDNWSDDFVVEPEGKALYNQDDLDTLHAAGFEPHSEWSWHRPVGSDEQGAAHVVTFAPGYRHDGRRLTPWIVTSHPSGRSLPASSVRRAIDLADRDAEATRKLPGYQATVYAFPDWTEL